MAWNDLTVRYPLDNARLVAMVSGGGVVIETGAFDYTEGRSPISFDDPGTPNENPTLQFVARFGVRDAPVPEASEAVEARIVLSGIHSDGPFEIRGEGWFGYDEHGNPEGWFEEPPVILVDSLGERAPFDEKPMTDAEFQAYLKEVHPRPPRQYRQALRAREIDVDDSHPISVYR